MALSVYKSSLSLIVFIGLMRHIVSQASHSCSQEYTLISENSCVRTSQDSNTDCVDLSTFLESFNTQVTDCLLLFLEPGYYTFDNLTKTVNYNLVLTGQEGVTIGCTDIETHSEDSDNYIAPLTFAGGYVTLERLSFSGCNRPLHFNDLDSVSIINCTFRDYTGSAIDLFNIDNILVHNCYFENCISEISKPRFHGNSGAISVGFYSNQTSSTNPAFTTITGSTFFDNRAITPPNLSSTQLQNALNNNVYHGRGGAIGVFLQENIRNITVLIEDCVFFNNSADSFGGAIYLIIGGDSTAHLFTIHSNNFTSNRVNDEGSYGGGIQLSLLNQNIDFAPSVFQFTNCHFEDNYGQYGGGLTTVQVYSQGAGNLVSVIDCTFVRNRAMIAGSALMFASFLYVQNRFESHHYLCENNSFYENSAPGGSFAATHINVNFQGHTKFECNEGPGLSITGAQIEVLKDAKISFVGNYASSTQGGALYLQDFGQIQLHSGSFLEFINNTGRIGSAIVVDVQRSSPVFSQLVFNPQCFLVYEDSILSPDYWQDVSITFSGNRASVGPAVYISHLDHCSWFLFTRANGTSNEINVTFSIEEIPNWPVFQFENKSNEATSFQDRSYLTDFYFQTEPVSIMSANNSKAVSIRPGERGRLNLLTMDQFGNPSYVVLRLSDLRSPINTGAFSQAGFASRVNNSDSGIVQFEPSLHPMLPSDQFVGIVYGFQNFSVEQFLENEFVPIIIDTPYNIRSTEQFVFNLSLVPCMPGFELVNTTVGDSFVSCLCIRDEFHLLDCEDDVLILRDGQWGAEEREPLPHLDLTPCPATYCQCYYRTGSVCETLFFQTDPSLSRQCHPLRNGTLCGRCVNGTGVGVLRTNCRDCGTGDNYFVLGLLIVVDVIAVSLILVLTVKLHIIFPSSLKGFLFYIQTVYYTTEYFPISFWNVRRYMLFVSSAIGLYFPWDFCLFPTMTALVSFTPKFTPAVIASLVSAVAITIVYVTRSRDGREYIWHGVWTLILLLYAPLLHTCAALLHCRYTPNAAGDEEHYHWYLDGEVECFQNPAHIALGLIAVLVLLVLVLLVPAIFLFTLCASSRMVQSKSRTVGWVYAALTAGYRDSWEARMYSSFELLRRLLLIGMAVVLPGRSVSNLYVLLNVLAVHLFFKPYSKIWHNVLEACVLLLYTLLLLIRSTPTFVESISPYSGTEVPDNWKGDLTISDGVTWLLAPFYYLPLLLAIVFIIAAIIYYVIKRFKNSARAWFNKPEQNLRTRSPSDFTEIFAVQSINYTKSEIALEDLPSP